LWRIDPALAPVDVVRGIQWIQIAGAWVFAAACLSAGTSVALAFAAVAGALAVLEAMRDQQFTVYPFLLIVPLVSTAVCVLIYQPMRHASGPAVAALAAAAGAIAAWNANIRTSSAPMGLAVFGVLILACARYRTKAGNGWAARQFATVSMVAFGLSALACNAVISYVLTPRRSVAASNYTHHPIMHALVTGLGVPSTPLSRSEGITWSDDTTWAIARRVSPGVGYLGPGYELALSRYYFGLWRTRPREMIATYWAKLLRTGHGVFLMASDVLPAWRPLRKVYLV